jgi:tartrate-resistant acid phosphatase type 5
MKKILSILLSAYLSTTFANHGSITPIEKNKKKLSGDVITFAAIGDYGKDNSAEEKVAKQVDSKNPDFIITMGDKYYSKYIGNYKGKYGQGALINRFFPSIGNHDWNALDECLYHGNLPYLEYFTLPGNELYYDFTKGPIHFFVVDSDEHQPDGNTIGSKQYHWLKQKLEESKACFKIVYFHHAPYSSGQHGSEKDLRWKFDELGADVVMSGHEHSYERIERDDILYFVNGAGGAEPRDFSDKVKGSKYRYKSKNGYMLIKANDHHMLFYFYNVNNSLKDSVMLTKLCG